MDAIVFDLDQCSISVYIKEINIHSQIKLKDDPRVSDTEFFEEDYQVAIMFKKKTKCLKGYKSYKERKGSSEKENKNEQLLKTNVCFRVYDTPKVKVSVTK